MDDSIKRLLNSLSQSSTEAMKEIKKMFWEGTNHWDALLVSRAAISGKLILTEHSQLYIKQFKAGKKGG